MPLHLALLFAAYMKKKPWKHEELHHAKCGRLKKTLEFKVELERQLAQYKNMVGFLQAEVSSLSRERDALKANLQVPQRCVCVCVCVCVWVGG